MIVAGIGFRAAASADSLQNALMQTGATPDALAMPSDKAETPVAQKLAAALGLPLIAITAEEMQREQTQTRSAKVLEKRGTGSVAEACALAAAGSDALLTTPRVISTDRLATCAIAEGASS